MVMDAAEYFESIKDLPLYSSGVSPLDALLNGGFQPGLTYHIFGNGEIFRELLHRTAFQIAKHQIKRDSPINSPIYFIDGHNQFSPYLLSNLAIANQIPSMNILNHIQVARAFNWNQLTEMLSDHIPKADSNTVLVDGWTNFLLDPSQFQTHIPKKTTNNVNPINNKQFHDLNFMIEGMKSVLKQPEPLIIATGALNEMSHYKALGGNLVRHFSMVLIEITENPQKIIFELLKHPCLPERRIELSISRAPIPVRMHAKYNKIDLPHNTRLDQYLKKP